MTEAEQDRAHELLYSCDSREELCGRIAELEAENKKLWTVVSVAWNYGMLLKAKAGRISGESVARNLVRVLSQAIADLNISDGNQGDVRVKAPGLEEKE